MEIGKTRNYVETRRLQSGVFSHNFEFFQFSRVLISQNNDSNHYSVVDITVYQYGKNVLYFFYNIAQRTLIRKREIFRVDIELYQHGS